MRYPGGKGKVYPHIINVMPPHRVYIEAFLGGGAVMRYKRPAIQNIGIDIDPGVIGRWKQLKTGEYNFHTADAIGFLEEYHFTGEELVYCDPPYFPSTRRRARVYTHDFSEDQHARLLALLRRLPCYVILSGYENQMYEQVLADWNRKTFRAKTHVDVREESLWFNFEPPTLLHDARYLGSSFRERQTIKRRLERLQNRIHRMDEVERLEFVRWINMTYGTQPGDNA